MQWCMYPKKGTHRTWAHREGDGDTVLRLHARWSPITICRLASGPILYPSLRCALQSIYWFKTYMKLKWVGHQMVCPKPLVTFDTERSFHVFVYILYLSRTWCAMAYNDQPLSHVAFSCSDDRHSVCFTRCYIIILCNMILCTFMCCIVHIL